MDYYRAAFEALGVEVLLNTEVTADLVAERKPDAVIVGTGSRSVIPGKIPGVTGSNVYTVEQVLTGQADLSAKNVTMIGAGITGIETAEYLAARKAKVTIVDLLDKVAPNANHTNVGDICGRLAQYGTEYLLGHALREIRSDAVVLEKQSDHSVVTVPTDAVVLSLGYRPDNALAEELKAKGLQVVTVGSAVKDGTIAPATRTGYEAARALFAKPEKVTAFYTPADELSNFGKLSLMDEQEGLYMVLPRYAAP